MQLGEIRAFAAKRITRAIPIRWVVTLQPCLCAAKKKGPGLESYRTWMVVKLQRWEAVNFCGLTMGSHCPRLTKEQNMVGENGEKSLSWIMFPIWSMGRLYIYLPGNHKSQPASKSKRSFSHFWKKKLTKPRKMHGWNLKMKVCFIFTYMETIKINRHGSVNIQSSHRSVMGLAPFSQSPPLGGARASAIGENPKHGDVWELLADRDHDSVTPQI